jgi:hypothetical protein
VLLLPSFLEIIGRTTGSLPSHRSSPTCESSSYHAGGVCYYYRWGEPTMRLTPLDAWRKDKDDWEAAKALETQRRRASAQAKVRTTGLSYVPAL